MTGLGLEHPTNTDYVSYSNNKHLDQNFRESLNAVGAQSGAPAKHADPALAKVVDRWSSLPQAIRAGIIAMIAASPQDGG